MKLPELLSSITTRLSPWVTATERTYRIDGMDEPQVFHSFRPPDYVSILAISEGGTIPLVRQFRPALERITLELPGGLLEDDEFPQPCAIRELLEETGFVCGPVIHALPHLTLDTGRLENKVHSFVALGVREPDSSWRPEPNLEVIMMSKSELLGAAMAGGLEHAGQVAIIGLAVMNGLLRLEHDGTE